MTTNDTPARPDPAVSLVAQRNSLLAEKYHLDGKLADINDRIKALTNVLAGIEMAKRATAPAPENTPPST